MAKNRLKRCEREEGESARSRPSNSASNSHSNSNSSSKEKENENPKKKRRVLKLMHARAYRELWLGTRPKIPKLSEVKMIESPSEKPKEALKEASILIVDHPLVHYDLEINKDDEINACLFCNVPPTGDLLFCEGKDCNKRCHVSCFDSSLKKPPAGAWFCVPCVQRKIQFGSHAVSKGPESIWDVKEGKYFVKYKSLAHVHNKWLSEAEILQEAPQLISEFNSLISKEKAPKWKKEWSEPQRILKTRPLMPPKTAEGFFANNKTLRFCNEEFLVKWRGLGYEKATWELESFLCWRTGEARNLLRELEERRRMAKDVSDPCFVVKALEVKEKPLIKLERLPAGTKNDCLISINKIREFWHGSKNALLIDEQEMIMKTVLFIQSVIKDIWRPILIISNENSISLWESELQRFEPRINTVTYTGTKKERELIQDLEFYEEGSNCVMVQVLISHPDAILEDFETIDCIGWGAVIIDEFKSSEISKKHDKLIKISTDFKLLLSSSPLNDEISEYSHVLSYLDPFNTDVKQTKNKNQALEMLKERLKNLVIYEQKHNFQEDLMDLIENVYERRKAVILQKHKKDTLKIEKYKEREKTKNKENSKLMSEFEIHVKRQYERLEEFYVGVRNSEERQKDEWIEKAKLGELEESFDNVPFFGFFSIEPFNWACKNEEIIEARNDKDMGNEETGSRNTVIEETGNGKTVNGEEMMNEETGNANVELTSQQKEADATEPVITPLAVEETVTGRETASEQVVNENAMDIDTETRDHTASPDLVEESCNDHETVKNDVVNESMRNGNEELVNDDETQMVEETVNGRETVNEQVLNESAMDTDTEMVEIQNGEPSVKEIGDDTTPTIIEETGDEIVKNDVVNESMRSGNEELVNDDETQTVEETVNGRETVNEQVLNESAMDTDTEMVEIQNGEPSVKETGDDTTPTIIEETGDEIVKNDVVNESMRSGNEELVNDETQTVQCEETVIGEMVNNEEIKERVSTEEMVNNEERVNNEEIKERVSTEEMVNNEERVNNEEIKERVSTEEMVNNEERVNNEEIKERVSTEEMVNNEERINNEEIKERVSTEEMVNNEEIKERVSTEEMVNNEEKINNEEIKERVSTEEMVNNEEIKERVSTEEMVNNEEIKERVSTEEMVNNEEIKERVSTEEMVNNEEIKERVSTEEMVNNEEKINNEEIKERVSTEEMVNNEEIKERVSTEEMVNNEEIKERVSTEEMVNNEEIKERVSTEEMVNNEEIKERVSTEEMVNNEEIGEAVNNEEICEAVNNEGVLCEEIVNGGEIIEEESVIDKTCDDQEVVKNDSVNENVRNGSEKLVSDDETQTVQCEADEPVNNEEVIIEEIVNEGMVNKEEMVNNGEKENGDVLPDTSIDQEAAATLDHSEPTRNELIKETSNNQEMINEREVENEDLMAINEEMSIGGEKGDGHILPDAPVNEETVATSDNSEPTRNELIKETSNNQEMINEREVENEDLMNIDQDQTSPTEINFVIETLNGPQIINVNMENQNGEEMVRTEMENPVALNNGVNSHGEMIEAIDEAVINKEMVIDPVDEETAIEEAVNKEAVTGNTVNGVTVIEGLVVIEEDEEDVLPVDQGTELTIPQIPIPCTNGNSPAPINMPAGATSAPNPQSYSTRFTDPITIQPSLPPQIHTPAGATSAPINTPAGATSAPINMPAGATSAPINTPAGATSSPINTPAGATSDPINTPAGTMSEGLRDPVLTQPALSQTQIPLDASNSFTQMVLSPDPLKNELMRIKYQTETLLRAYQHKKMQVKTEFEEEMARVRRKYEDLEREAELEFQAKKKWIKEIYQKLRENLSLAEQFRALYLGQQQTSISSFLQVQGRSQVPLPVPLRVQLYQQQINTSQNQTLRQFGTQSFPVPTSSSFRPAGVSTGEDLSFSFPPVLDQRGLFANIPSTSQGTTNRALTPILRPSQTPPVRPFTNLSQTQLCTEQRSPAPHLVFRPAGGAATSSSTAELATNQRFSARQLRNFLGAIRAQELPQSGSGGNFGNDWRNLSASFGGNDGSNGRNGGSNGDVAGSDRFGG